MVSTGGSENLITVVPQGSTTDLYVLGDQPGKTMSRVGQGAGEWQQVTTYRYVGLGAGDFKVDPPKDAEDLDCSCATKWPIFWCMLCVVVCMGVIALLVWPSEGGELLERTKAAFLSRTVSSHLAETTEAPTQAAVTARSRGGLDIEMVTQEVDWPYVSSDPSRREIFDGAVRVAVAFYVGHDTPVDRVDVTKLPASDILHVDVIPRCGVDVDAAVRTMNLEDLADAVTSNLRATPLWEDSVKDRVVVKALDVERFSAPCSDSEVHTALKIRREERPGMHVAAERATEAATPATTQAPLTQAPTTQAPTMQDPTTQAATQAATQTTTQATSPTTTQATTTHSLRCQLLEIAGAEGQTGRIVNGEYRLKSERFNEHDIYQNANGDDMWLAFMQGRWYVTDSARVEQHKGGGWLFSEESLDKPDKIQAWQAWTGTEWARAPDVSVRCRSVDAP